ncbi:protein translocase subunit SecF [Candidatus Roizmanbacteria bacterium]|nr:protein translocase subunit SecF [Candidatus Roizmanbacteria bacterium]
MVNFLKYKWLYFTISAIVILVGLFSIFRWGFIYSIDFVGGTNIEYKTGKAVSSGMVRNILIKKGVSAITLRISPGGIFIRAAPTDEKKEKKLREALEKDLDTKVEVLRFETVGPIIGKETVRKTIIATLLGVSAILIYMSFAFRGFNFAVSAILALVHDLMVLVGMYALLSHFFGAQVDTLFVTAVLTTMSFSVHDTIVIFDKIREHMKEEGRRNVEHIANKALTETMVRSLNNSMTIVFVLLALTLLGGSTIRFFIIALLVGTITGTYSSPFIATPILVWMEGKKE